MPQEPPSRVERRLSAILAADVAGYSRLMHDDEEATHSKLAALLTDAVNPAIAEHRGRIVKNTGDGFLAEFPSAVGAVRAAMLFQTRIKELTNAEVEDRRIAFRVGINIGDVIVEPHDIFGDGVNIAARLESIAAPGGVCISASAYDHVRGKVDVEFADLGEQSLKNIARPVRVYSVKTGLGASASAPHPSASERSGRPRLSIVVLPFANIGSDPEQEYFVDGLTESLTTDLSRVSGTFVIARNTAFTYKGKTVDARKIGRDLGVRYVMEGSVQSGSTRIRVNAQLVDAESGAHLWAERFDKARADLFDMQDEITSRIANALNIELIAAEATRPIEQPDAFDFILRGRAAAANPPNPDKYAKSIGYFERALALDPRSVEAQSLLAIALTARVLDQMTDSATTDIARAEKLAGQSLAASPRCALAHFAKGQVLRVQRRYKDAIPEYEAVIALNPNSAGALFVLAQCKSRTGSIEEAIPLVEQAIRLSPRDPQIGNWYLEIGIEHLLQSRTEEAIVWLEKARSANPLHPAPHAFLASAYGLKGEADAAAELAEARRLVRDGRFSSIARLKAIVYWGVPKTRALLEATYFTGLRKAGVPEE